MDIFDNIVPTESDIVISSVPLVISTIPVMAPAVLKSIALRAGHSCSAIDLNVNVLNWVDAHQYKDKFLDFFHNGTYHAEIVDELFDLHYAMATKLLSYNAKIIGLSLFSYVCQHSAKYLCYFLRKLNPDVQIIIGGAGCFDSLRGNSTYADKLKACGLVDHYFRGDAEKSFEAFLNGTTEYPGLDNSDWQEIPKEELNTFPYPNYDDYKFDQYELQCVPVLGSRGCVRKCTFCDIIEYWKKFNYRSGESVFNEMLAQNQKYGIRHFKFQDSLINGNMKEFKVLVSLLAKHNQEHPENSFTWASYFIIRPKSTFDEDLWRLTALSGATGLQIGVESLVEHIRYHMGKHFSNDDLEFALQMGKKYNLQFLCLMIVGYVTETQADVDFAAQWWKDHVEYKDLLKIQFGGTLGIFPNTQLERNKKVYKIHTYGPPYQNWNNEDNTSTPEIRAGWQKYLYNLCKDLGYGMFNNIDNHYVLELMLKGRV